MLKKILVCAKRVVDANVKVRVKADNSNVEIERSKMSLNPFDENAIEAAVMLKDGGYAAEIIAVSIGNEKCADTLRVALARGCDRGILVKSDELLDPINIAKILAQIVKQEKPQLILLGKQAIDDDANQVGQMLAGMLDYPQGTFISKLEVIDEETIQVERELDNGTETLSIQLPAVLTADLHLNEPRFIKLPQLMLAKKKTVEQIDVNDLAIEIKPSVRLLKAVDGEIKKPCKILGSVDDLVSLLKAKKVCD